MEPHQYYHHPKHGCNLVPETKPMSNGFGYRRGNKHRLLHYQICLTHGVDVCRCGWEFKKHPVNQEKHPASQEE